VSDDQREGYLAYIRPIGQQPEATAAAAARPAERKKVRNTVDLAADEQHALKSWQNETAFALGQRVTTQDVLRAAVQVLLEDETVARGVRAKLDEAPS
jgi:hypothetical protein